MAVQAGLYRTWSETPKDRFSQNEAQFYFKHFKIQAKRLCHGVIPPNDAYEIANSEDPDQTAPLGAA